MTMIEQLIKATDNKKAFALTSINLCQIALSFFQLDDEGNYVNVGIFEVDDTINSLEFYKLMSEASELELNVKYKNLFIKFDKYL